MILANWAAAGLIGLISTLLFFLFLVRRLASLLLPGHGLIAILMLPLIVKMMVAGNAGHPELASLLIAVLAVELPLARDAVRTRKHRRRAIPTRAGRASGLEGRHASSRDGAGRADARSGRSKHVQPGR